MIHGIELVSRWISNVMMNLYPGGSSIKKITTWAHHITVFALHHLKVKQQITIP